VNGAGHFAFLPPCGEALAKQVPQICIDAPGFDREAFHRDFNREVVGFFQKAPYSATLSVACRILHATCSAQAKQNPKLIPHSSSLFWSNESEMR